MSDSRHGVQIIDLDFAPADDPVIGDHDANYRGEEDGVGREVRSERVGVLEEL